MSIGRPTPSMRLMRIRFLTASALAATLVACSDDRPRIHAPTTTPVVTTGFMLAIGDLHPGQTSAIHGIFRRPENMPAVGSYTVRITYDTTRLVFDGDASAGQGMRVMNAKDGILTIAAASTEGFGSDTMFAARFRVLAARADAGLSADVVEMYSVGFANLVPVLDARTVRPRRLLGGIR
jgi:hypothetical protein